MIENEINAIKNKDDFVIFVQRHVIDKENPLEVNDYLISILSWVRDMEGFYLNSGEKKPDNMDWKLIATLLYVGLIYE